MRKENAMRTETPVYDFVTEYIEKDMSRFHMPGHKGRSFLGCEIRDITEIEGADYLLEADGIIARSEKIASSLFGTACTVYSTEGSTLAMKAMLKLAADISSVSGRRFRILAGRNVHKSFIHACALLDYEAEWLYGENPSSVYTCTVTPQVLCRKLEEMQELPDAVFITSPDYTGTMADIRGLAEVCHDKGILLLVDNAHGAYLRFLEESMHPMDLGADLCCDSAHKTLPVLTGGAYLHISHRIQEKYGDLHAAAKKAMSLFASTSPSYLILQSLDLCNAYLSGTYRRQLADTCIQVEKLQKELETAGVHIQRKEPCKLLVDCAYLGMSGAEAAAYLRKHQIECEFADLYDIVLMITPQNEPRDFIRIKEALADLAGKRMPLQREYPALSLPKRVCSIREALLSPSIRIPVEKAEGYICASPAVSCPPEVPIAVSGELLTESVIHAMQWYGISCADVIRR